MKPEILSLKKKVMIISLFLKSNWCIVSKKHSYPWIIKKITGD